MMESRRSIREFLRNSTDGVDLGQEVPHLGPGRPPPLTSPRNPPASIGGRNGSSRHFACASSCVSMQTSLEEGIELHRLAGIFPAQSFTELAAVARRWWPPTSVWSSVAIAMISPASSTMLLMRHLLLPSSGTVDLDHVRKMGQLPVAVPARFQSRHTAPEATHPMNVVATLGLSFNNNKKQLLSDFAGGESGIRTHGTVSRTHAFQACALSHSAISPDDPLLAGHDRFCK